MGKPKEEKKEYMVTYLEIEWVEAESEEEATKKVLEDTKAGEEGVLEVRETE